MAHKILDRAQETTTGTGLGALALAGATSRMRSLVAAGAVDGDTFWGLIEHATAAEYEVTLCTYAGGAITRAATPLLSSTGAKIDFSAGVKTISCVAPGSKSQIADADGNVLMSGPIISQGVFEAVDTPAIAAGVVVLDLAKASTFVIANNADVTAINIASMAIARATAITLILTADGSSRNWVWPQNVTWRDGPPTLSSVDGKRDLFVGITSDGGMTWLFAVYAQNL